MPLVVVCGLPAAGKSFVATQLVDYLKQYVQEDVVYITEATVNVNRLEGYKNGHIEKMSRGALRAGVEQALNSKSIVVLDALNYIKGSRYEFYCKARAESTTYCVVYVDTPLELALERNASQEAQYDPELIKSIASRFEVPIEKNRWDSPLFHLTPEAIAKDGLMLDKIAEAVQFGKAMKAGLATQSAPVVETSFIQELEQVTTLIVDALIAHQRDGGVADALKVPKASIELRLNRNMPTSEARRHRRQFIKISQLHPCAVAAIGDLFVEYMNKQA
ncbi:hypothetical protein Poli38472_005219 [Pythium oligandrum]|uniref:KTI12-like protein n=1 Tax=Pythium oligandrum TaxID=41045 RepID=A0A8K1CFN2_PYTOL|nr:hypothetical protein Poli38472_005219 [Pythium oligandrum]|eukprot:TMW62601.1 hypothetical protein Poli38472_005219 [Pythium oligandrum]